MGKLIYTSLALLAIFITSLALSPPQRVSAISKNISAPFDVGSTWYVCQGYNSGGSHAGTSRLGLDLTAGPNCDSSGSGRPIRAPFSGTVAWYVEPSGSMCINSKDGKSVMLTHVNNSVSRGATVSTGQQVATIAPSGQRQNNGVAHLHLQGWTTSGCGNNSTIAPFDLAHNLRICGAPDMKEGGAWRGTRFIARRCTDVDKKAEGYIYRFWSDQKQRHFYTMDHSEAQEVVDKWPDVWTYEPHGTFKAVPVNNESCSNGFLPVYRFWSDQKQGHFYTASESEKNSVIANWPGVWKYEKIAFCASTTPVSGYSDPVYRFWSDQKQGHFYTASESEKNSVIANWPGVWKYEKIEFYVSK